MVGPMTLLRDMGLNTVLGVIVWICLAAIDSAFVAWIGDLPMRTAAAVVAGMWLALIVFVESDSVDRNGVIGHIVIRALLYPMLALQVVAVVWILG